MRPPGRGVRDGRAGRGDRDAEVLELDRALIENFWDTLYPELEDGDAEFRAGFDRKITEWATDFMERSKAAGKPFYVYLPYTQVHIPPIPDLCEIGAKRHRLLAG
jgi:hypothetical protein